MYNVNYKPCGRCGNRISKDSILCPYCKSKNPFPVQNFVVLFIIFPIMALGIGATAIQHFLHPNSTTPLGSSTAASAPILRITQNPEAGSLSSKSDEASGLAPTETPSADVAVPANTSGVPTALSSGEIGSAVRQALDTGEPASFSTGTYKGQVSVSTAELYGTKECRSYRYTVIGDDKDQTLDGTACRVGQGTWNLDGKPG